MRYRTIFIGNLPLFLDVLQQLSDLQLIVAEHVAGRRRAYFGSAIQYAREQGIAYCSPGVYLNNPIDTDLIVVAGYGRLLPSHVIRSPRLGIVNIHPSLLPAYRGRNPLNWALINGEGKTGVTIHHVNDRFDDGGIILQKPFPIRDTDSFLEVHDMFVRVARDLIKELFKIAETPAFKGVAQDPNLVSYYRRIVPIDGRIRFDRTATQARNLVRAFGAPYSGAYFYNKGRRIIVDELVGCQEPFPKGRMESRVWSQGGRVFLKMKDECVQVNKVRSPMSMEVLIRDLDVSTRGEM
jgi:methionyl-tRNA formyltransferase